MNKKNKTNYKLQHVKLKQTEGRVLKWCNTYKKVKIVCVHVILYIHSHKRHFPYISMASITTFPGTSLIPEWILG